MGEIYVIESINPHAPAGLHVVKIGASGYVEERMRALSVGAPYRLRLLCSAEVGEAAYEREHEFHQRYAAQRIDHGPIGIGTREWFELDAAQLQDLLAAISVGQQPIADDICDYVGDHIISLAQRRHYPAAETCSMKCAQAMVTAREMGIAIFHQRADVRARCMAVTGPRSPRCSAEEVQKTLESLSLRYWLS